MPKVQDKYFNCGLSEIFFSATILSKNAGTRGPFCNSQMVTQEEKLSWQPHNQAIKFHAQGNERWNFYFIGFGIRTSRRGFFTRNSFCTWENLRETGCYFLTLSVDFGMNFMEANRAKMANLQSIPWLLTRYSIYHIHKYVSTYHFTDESWLGTIKRTKKYQECIWKYVSKFVKYFFKTVIFQGHYEVIRN